MKACAISRTKCCKGRVASKFQCLLCSGRSEFLSVCELLRVVLLLSVTVEDYLHPAELELGMAFRRGVGNVISRAAWVGSIVNLIALPSIRGSSSWSYLGLVELGFVNIVSICVGETARERLFARRDLLWRNKRRFLASTYVNSSNFDSSFGNETLKK